MWFIGVEVEQETSAPPPKKNPGSAAVVVGSPTTDLLESVDCVLRDCVRNFTNADRNNDRFS